MKSTDKYIITGVELPIVVDTATGVIVYDKADTVFSAGDWPSYKSTVSGAVKAGLIKPVKDVKEPVVEDEVIPVFDTVEEMFNSIDNGGEE